MTAICISALEGTRVRHSLWILAAMTCATGCSLVSGHHTATRESSTASPAAPPITASDAPPAKAPPADAPPADAPPAPDDPPLPADMPQPSDAPPVRSKAPPAARNPPPARLAGSGKDAAKGSASARAPHPPGAGIAATPAQASKPVAPSLDLAGLEQRLKDTKAIGVFTKLSLKNQVDDLLDEFRAFHKSTSSTPPAALRNQYDLLMIKVLSLLQNGDPQLASSIASSREALWDILKDPDKFAKI